VADETGGKAFWVRKMEDLPDAIEAMNRQIRSEYVLGYSPGVGQNNDGKYHRVRVQVRPPAGLPRVQIFWKRGYLALGQ
jgi:Ca-activated chloride channel family protein